MAHRILIVDDEENIVSALRRLLQKSGYEVITASSGEAALDLLEKHEVELILSDYRMPGLSGVEFFQIVKKLKPETIRVIISGFADFDNALNAINKGDIYRFVTKPWNGQELLDLVREGLDQYDIRRVNAELNEMVAQQNEELKKLNETLEEKVAERTAELVVALHKSDMVNASFKTQNTAIIKAFAGLIDLRYPIMGDHCRRVARLVKPVCRALGITDQSELQQIVIAALLHDIGKIGLPDATLAKSDRQLIGAERQEVMNHPIIGQGQVQIVDQLASVGLLIRYHHENFNGSGFPDKLAGEGIPLGARILRVLDSFDHHIRKIGGIEGGQAKSVIERMLPDMGVKYDYDVMQALMAALDIIPEEFRLRQERKLSIHALTPGMTLARDLRTKKGHLILPADEPLEQGHIDKIKSYSKLYALPNDVYVYEEEERRE